MEVNQACRQQYHESDKMLTEGSFAHTTAQLERGCMDYGCSHYRRRCKIRAPCCNEMFDCRHCHNEAKNIINVDKKQRHDIPRHQVQQVICSLCGIEQEVRQICISCGVCMGKYFCETCKFFDDDTSKKQYHCEGCGICRIGGRENFFHCNKCRCCYSVVLMNCHPCIEGAMHQDCPVCFEYLFESTNDVTVLRCGHTIHANCLKEMQDHFQYACPLCSKSVCDMSKVWEKFDMEIAATPMPESFQNKRESLGRLLVYEFMPRGSLENHLFRRGSYFQPLSWNLRLKVAFGAAKGLAFLHSAEVKVIYRDFKTSNVLLDTSYNAKLSDFGLAKDGPAGDKSHVSTRVMGTYGYAAPEYLATGHLTSKSDVYSFGVVLLEMLSGRRAVDKNRPSGEHNLVEWARPYLTNKRKIFRILDNRLEGQYNLDAAHKVATLAFHCLSAEIKLRPAMANVVKELEKLQDFKGTGNSQSNSNRLRRRSTGDAVPTRAKANASYPRPSASPLYA